jgi:hypothetical protein
VKPTVLIATTCSWFPTARLAMGLVHAGFTVDAVCPPRHPMSKTNVVRRSHTYRGLAPLMSFIDAIEATRPDLIVPGDDLATRHLHHLYERERSRGVTGRSTCDLIERSLGAPESFAVVYARSAFMQLAREEGILAPATEVILDLEELTRWIAEMGFPTVLKVDGTSGGDGVRIVHTIAKAERAFRTLQAPPLLARAAKRALVDKDKTLVWSLLFRKPSVVNAQSYLAGHEATSTVACWKGTVLASLHFEVLHKRDPKGPATVVRLIEDADMSMAAEKIVRRLKLSGVHGFDFVRGTETGRAHLIEINPRATQVGHLTLGAGHDLPAALYAAVTGERVRPAPKVSESTTIALFPQEWIRDAASPQLQSCYHDVPWEQPELVLACVHKRTKQPAWHWLREQRVFSSEPDYRRVRKKTGVRV